MSFAADILSDAFARIRDGVVDVLDGVSAGALVWRADPGANTVAWLIWHLTRVQDDHVAEAFGRPQVWTEAGWADRFGLPFATDETGYGHTPEQVAQVNTEAGLLGGYHRAVAAQTAQLLAGLAEPDLDRVVDERFDPPVTLAVRLVSVVSDDLQHIGQAAFVRGMAEQAGA